MRVPRAILAITAGGAFLLAGLLAPAPAAALPILVGNAHTVVREVNAAVGTDVRTIIVDSELFQDEEISTKENSAVRIIFRDKTVLSIGENSRLKLTKLIFDADPAKSRIAVKMLGGVFRWTSGGLPSSAYGIASPIATIGVRGTTIEMMVREDNTTIVAVAQGRVVAGNLRNETVSLDPGESTTILPADADDRQPPPSDPGPPPSDFVDAIRKMTIMLRLSDPPTDIVPAAGPGADEGRNKGFDDKPSYGNGTRDTDAGGNGSLGGVPTPFSFPTTGSPHVNTGSGAPDGGNPPSNNPSSNNPGGSNPGSGNPGGGNPSGGNPGTGNTGTGNTGTGNTGTGNTGTGNTGTGNTPPSDPPVVIGSTKATVTPPAPTRIGTTGTATLLFERDDAAGQVLLKVNPLSGVFSGAGTGPAGVTLDPDGKQLLAYTFIPTGHGTASANLPVTSGGSQGVIVLTGIGVGPQATSNHPDGLMQFGTMPAGVHRTLALEIANASPDAGFAPSQVGLTLLSLKLTGNWASLFTVTGFQPGAVLMPGDAFEIDVTYTAPDTVGFFDNTLLTILTDEDAAFGNAGRELSFRLSGGTLIPEPASWSLVTGPFALALALLARRRRRTR